MPTQAVADIICMVRATTYVLRAATGAEAVRILTTSNRVFSDLTLG